MTLHLGVLTDLHGSLDPRERDSWHGPFDFAGLPARIADALAWFAAEDVDLVAIAGDLTQRADATTLDAVLRQAVDGSDRRMLVVAGNHDLDADGHAPLSRAIARVASNQLTLAQPHGTRHGRVRIAGVHAAPAAGAQHGLEHPPAVDAWGADPVVLLSHFPLLSHGVELALAGLAHPGDVADRARLAQQLIDRCAPTIVISGHLHARIVDAEGPLLQLTLAALVEPPFDATIVDVDARPGGEVHVARRTRSRGATVDTCAAAIAASHGAWLFGGASWSAHEDVAGAASNEGGGHG